MMRSLTVAAAALALATLPACSIFMRSMEKPTAEVRDVSITSAGFGGVSGQLALDVTNPNSFGVPLSGIDWTLTIGTARAVTGRTELSQTIPAKGAAPVVTSLSISTLDAAMVASQLASGARNYRIDVTLHFSTRVGEIDVAVQHDGSLGSGLALR